MQKKVISKKKNSKTKFIAPVLNPMGKVKNKRGFNVSRTEKKLGIVNS